MFKTNEITTNEQIMPVLPASNVTTARDATKDTGRVHIGGGMMRFDSTKDAGRVHVGGGMMRF